MKNYEKFRFILEQIKFIFTKDFRLFGMAIWPDIGDGIIKSKGAKCTCKYNKNTHKIIEVRYAAQNQILPEYTMVYILDRKAKKVHKAMIESNK